MGSPFFDVMIHCDHVHGLRALRVSYERAAELTQIWAYQFPCGKRYVAHFSIKPTDRNERFALRLESFDQVVVFHPEGDVIQDHDIMSWSGCDCPEDLETTHDLMETEPSVSEE